MSLMRGNAVALPLRDESVDLAVTSPPYFALRSYRDGDEHYDGQIGSEPTPAAFLAALWTVTDELWRVLKPSGSVFVNLGDKFSGAQAQNTTARNGDDSAAMWRQTNPRNTGVRNKSRMLLPHRFALGCIDPDYRRHVTGTDGPQWICRMDMVWSKPNGLPESVTDRVRASHEYWFHLTKSERYFAAVDEVRETATEPWRSTGRMEQRGDKHLAAGVNGGFGLSGETPRDYNPLGKLPGSVWTIPTEPLVVPPHIGVDHFAAFPTEWPRRLILGWTPTGICCACGEGRRPVTGVEYVPVSKRNTNVRVSGLAADGTYGKGRPGGPDAPYGDARKDVTITGYACACPTPDVPTRPAVILDPFVGTGTVVAVANALGRHGIGIDLSNDYLKLAAWRCGPDGVGPKVAGRTNREAQGTLL